MNEECIGYINKTNQKFKYKTDESLYGHEEVWAGGLDEMGFGDCEDYALEIRKHCGGDIYYCEISGWGHAVLNLPNGQWIDNVNRKPLTKLDNRYRGFKKYPVWQVWIKLAVGWIKKKIL